MNVIRILVIFLSAPGAFCLADTVIEGRVELGSGDRQIVGEND